MIISANLDKFQKKQTTSCSNSKKNIEIISVNKKWHMNHRNLNCKSKTQIENDLHMLTIHFKFNREMKALESILDVNLKIS